MSNPQQPELRRTGYTPATQDSWVQEDRDDPGATDRPAPVPEANQPGHHPEVEQDKPDLDHLAEALGVPPEGDEEAG